MGLVTVALLTLPPLALRPVRLACLIHAANVHSEPGSNPSKMRTSSGTTSRPDAALPQKGLRSVIDPSRRIRRASPPDISTATRSLMIRPTGPASRPGPAPTNHAGFPQGFTSRSTELSKNGPPHAGRRCGHRLAARAHRWLGRGHRPRRFALSCSDSITTRPSRRFDRIDGELPRCHAGNRAASSSRRGHPGRG